jgi:hypothetical protein
VRPRAFAVFRLIREFKLSRLLLETIETLKKRSCRAKYLRLTCFRHQPVRTEHWLCFARTVAKKSNKVAAEMTGIPLQLERY